MEGTCSVTGKLIARQGLEASPETTKGVGGRRREASGQRESTAQDIARRAVERRERPNKIISKIKKPPPPPRKVEKKRKKPGRKPRKVEEDDDDLI